MNTQKLIAQLYNPVLQPGWGGEQADAAKARGGNLLADYIAIFWRTLIVLGGLVTLLFLVWGALDWILAGGEEAKVSAARKKMTGAVIGMALLAASVVIVEFIGMILGFSLLKITFPTPS